MGKLKELQQLSLATTYEVDDSFDSDKLIKMRLRVCHDGINPNNSEFEVDDMNNSKDSIKNIPVLANVLFDEDGQPQFCGHDMTLEESKVKEGEYKLIYKETPIGVVPESCNYEVAEFNGKNYVFVDAYIWKDYSNYAQDIIERDNDIKLSMEIIVDAYSYNSKDKTYKITDYRYQGITFLNKDFGTGMENALATTGTFNAKETKDRFIIMMDELKDALLSYDINNNGEGGNDEVKEKLELMEKYNVTAEQLDFNIEDFSVEELDLKLKELSVETKEPILFSATYNQKHEALNNALDPIIVKDQDGNCISETYYYVLDFSDEYAMVSKSVWDANGHERTYGRFTYMFDETTLVATITSEFEKMIVDVWLTQAEYDALMAERKNLSESFEALKGEFEDYKTNYSTPNSEVEELKNFQSDKIAEERQLAETELFEQFAELEGNEEFEALKSKSVELDLDTLQKECFAILGKKSAKFTSKPQASKKVKIGFTKTEKTVGEYDELFEKHI